MAVPKTVSGLAERLAFARRRAGLRLEEASVKADVSSRAITSWERGEHSPIAPGIVRLADVYGISLDWLAGRTDAMSLVISRRARDLVDWASRWDEAVLVRPIDRLPGVAEPGDLFLLRRASAEEVLSQDSSDQPPLVAMQLSEDEFRLGWLRRGPDGRPHLYRGPVEQAGDPERHPIWRVERIIRWDDEGEPPAGGGLAAFADEDLFTELGIRHRISPDLIRVVLRAIAAAQSEAVVEALAGEEPSPVGKVVSHLIHALAALLGVPAAALAEAARALREAVRETSGTPTDLVTQAEAARFAGTSRELIRQLVQRGVLRGWDVPGARGPMVRLSEVAALYKKGRNNASDQPAPAD